MTTIEKQIEIKNKIIIGLEKTYEKLLVYKKQKQSYLVVIQKNKIVKLKP
jgi:hypothetical protein